MKAFSASLTNFKDHMESHDFSCHLSRRTLASSPLWQQKHTDTNTHTHTPELWQPRLNSVTCAWSWRVCGITPAINVLALLYVFLSYYVYSRTIFSSSRKAKGWVCTVLCYEIPRESSLLSLVSKGCSQAYLHSTNLMQYFPPIFLHNSPFVYLRTVCSYFVLLFFLAGLCVIILPGRPIYDGLYWRVIWGKGQY